MNTFTSITYSHSKQNGADEVRKIEYKSTVEEDGKLMSTSYVNTMTDKNLSETFNKLLKSDYEIYEQVGNSCDKRDWKIKEFHNNNLNKEYHDAYSKHNFDNCLNIDMPASANKNLLLNNA
jgi:hypothetical protein